MDIVPCPDPSCAAPAEVLDRWELWSTDGPVPHLKTLCVQMHVFTAPCGAPNRGRPGPGSPRRTDEEVSNAAKSVAQNDVDVLPTP